jgi:hypothetical protein
MSTHLLGRIPTWRPRPLRLVDDGRDHFRGKAPDRSLPLLTFGHHHSPEDAHQDESADPEEVDGEAEHGHHDRQRQNGERHPLSRPSRAGGVSDRTVSA